MDFNLDFRIIRSHKLLFTPRMKQAIKVLEMNSQELFEYVRDQVEENPVLLFASPEKSPYENDYCTSMEGETVSKGAHCFDNYIKELSLQEYLVFQLHISDADRMKKVLGEYLIDSVDENGYINANLAEAAAFFNVPSKKVLSALRLLQTFDPPGVCARNLKECLILQLRQKPDADSRLFTLVERNLDDVAGNAIRKVAREYGIKAREAHKLFVTIRNLEPKPGREFGYGSSKYIVPDIIIKSTSRGPLYFLNKNSIPVLQIDSYYKEIMASEIQGISNKYIHNKLNSAGWLIKCIELRKAALKKLAHYLVKTQSDFLLKKADRITPASIANASAELEINEYLLELIIKGKFLQCAQGSINLSEFFEGK
ncbi:MAG: hypothetical protein PHV32_18625 [Eubacteriales bacterium]|nr:hypothetical protein [Eubacteriales bacterium]